MRQLLCLILCSRSDQKNKSTKKHFGTAILEEKARHEKHREVQELEIKDAHTVVQPLVNEYI